MAAFRCEELVKGAAGINLASHDEGSAVVEQVILIEVAAVPAVRDKDDLGQVHTQTFHFFADVGEGRDVVDRAVVFGGVDQLAGHLIHYGDKIDLLEILVLLGIAVLGVINTAGGNGNGSAVQGAVSKLSAAGFQTALVALLEEGVQGFGRDAAERFRDTPSSGQTGRYWKTR